MSSTGTVEYSDVGSKPRTATVSPVARPPRWLLWLFPGLEDLSRNPLYIRLSGRGYGRRGILRGMTGPREFLPASIDGLILTRLGFWPIMIAVTIYAALEHGTYGTWYYSIRGNLPLFALLAIFYWAILFSVSRLILGRPRHAVIHFYHRARIHYWGEDLVMAGLTPQDITAALVGALLPRVALSRFVLSLCFASPFIATMIVERMRYPAALSAYEMLRNISFALFYASITNSFFIGIESLEIFQALRQIKSLPHPDHFTPAAFLRGFVVNSAITFKLLFLPFIFGLISLTYLNPLINMTPADSWRELLKLYLCMLTLGLSAVWAIGVARRWRGARPNLSASMMKLAGPIAAAITGALISDMNLPRIIDISDDFRDASSCLLGFITVIWSLWLIRRWINRELQPGAEGDAR